jgi:hypothetical protein
MGTTLTYLQIERSVHVPAARSRVLRAFWGLLLGASGLGFFSFLQGGVECFS